MSAPATSPATPTDSYTSESPANASTAEQPPSRQTTGTAATIGNDNAPGPQGIQERRAAVRDRVGQEVLAFIAAIERGDAATAEGFPPPPGATANAGGNAINLLEGLRAFGGVGGGSAGGTGASPASQEAVKRLPRIEVCVVVVCIASTAHSSLFICLCLVVQAGLALYWKLNLCLVGNRVTTIFGELRKTGVIRGASKSKC